jgi:hypothetical protein
MTISREDPRGLSPLPKARGGIGWLIPPSPLYNNFSKNLKKIFKKNLKNFKN